MDSCIQVTELSKIYHKKAVVNSISFRVEQGQIFAFLGPNGAGKSTTMNILSTLLSKSDGSVVIDGLDLDHHKREIKEKIGIVFQTDVLDDALTVYQNLLYRGGLYHLKREELKGRIQDISTLLSLESILPKKYKECSGGQKRLAQIARALLPAPKLLILDEPTTGLDPVTRRNVWQVLLTLRQKLHMTIFFTTHYLEEALYADRYCILKQGEILLCDSLQFFKQLPSETSCGGLDTVYFNLLSEGNRQ